MIPIRGRLTGTQETVSAFNQLPGLLMQAGEGAMREGLELISETSRRDYLSGPYPQHLQPRTQRLRASMRRGDRDNIFRVRSQGSTIIGEIGTQVVYARIHEVGGVIRPTRGQYLAIPTERAKTPGGVVKAEFNQPLRQIPGLFLQRSRRGNLFAARRRGRRGALEVLFNLVRQARIPPRPFLEPAAQKSVPAMQERFRVRLQTVVDRLNQTLQRVRG